MKNKRITDYITVISFVLIIAVLAVAFVLTPDREVSETENRSLQTLPPVSWEKITDGSFTAELNSYFSDQFPFRDSFIGLKSLMELALLRGENNDVLISGGELAVKRFTLYDGRDFTGPSEFYIPLVVSVQCENLCSLNETMKSAGVDFRVMIPPRTIDVKASAFDYTSEVNDELNRLIACSLEDAGFIDILPVMREKYEGGEYVYYNTDHHWTTLGAYYAYCEIMKSYELEGEIIPVESFETETVSDSFYGTTYSKSGFRFVSPDAMEYWHLDGDEDIVTVKDGKRLDGFYDRDYLDKTDKYSSFIGGNSTRTSIDNPATDRKMLLIKDSFALSLAPFLARHFDLEIVNVADGTGAVTNMAAEYGCDYALVVYNTENIIGSGALAFLN